MVSCRLDMVPETFVRRERLDRPYMLIRLRIYTLGFCYDTYMHPHTEYMRYEENIPITLLQTRCACVCVSAMEMFNGREVPSSRRVDVVSLPMRIRV